MFRILVDSAANIPAEVVKQYNIEVLSFVNQVDGKPVVCFDPDLSPEEEREKGKEYYDAMRNGLEIKTGLISTGIFAEKFTEILKAGEDVLYFSLSKNISGNYNSAVLGAQMAKDEANNGHEVRVVDSMNASLGQGLLAIYASEMRDKGMSFKDVADEIETYPLKMNGIFTVGDLKYLSRTGRISGAKAMVGNVLGIKPLLKGNSDGYIVQFKTVKGRKKSLNALADLVINNIVNPEEQIIGIAHADAYDESLYVMNRINEKVKVRGFINTSYDFCTGSHVGPETIALFFIAKDRELENE